MRRFIAAASLALLFVTMEALVVYAEPIGGCC